METGNMKKMLTAVLVAAAAIAAAVFYAPLASAYTTAVSGKEYNAVKDFGADGSDKLDDTAQIQAALDRAKETDGKVTVTLPAGTYYVDRRLLIYSNTTLRLAPNAVMRRTNNLDYIIVSGEDAPDRQKDRLLSHDIVIDGGTWDGTPSTTKESKGVIKVYNSDSVRLSNAKITNVCGTHFALFDGVSNLTVKNCEFSNFIDYTGTAEDYKAQVFAGLNYWSAEALHIDFLDKSSSLLNGRPYIPCENVTVSGCRFKNLTSALGTHHVFDYMFQDNVSIHDNVFENCSYDCINATSFRNLKIYDNTAVRCGGFAVLKKTQGEIYSNTAYLVRNPTGKLYAKGKFGGNSPYFYGVEASNGCDLVIKNNDLSNASSHSIYVNKDSCCDIRDNTVSGGKGNGICVWNGSSADVIRNKISSCSVNGISVKSGSKVSQCSRNSIKRCSDNGIYVNSATLVSSKYNTVSSNGLNGYSFSTGAKGVITNNDISNSSDNGVYLSSKSNVTASSNYVYSNRKCAFAVASGSAAKITYNNISANRSYDLHVRTGSVNVTFKSNGSDKNKTKVDKGCKAELSPSKKCLRADMFSVPKTMTYTGRQIRPAAASSLRRNKDYAVSYGTNINTGEGTVTVSGKGAYSGILTFRFNIVPKRGALTDVSAENGSVSVKWKSDSQCGGYNVDISSSPSFSGAKRYTVGGKGAHSYRISGLESGKRYFVRVRSYKTINGTACYGSWSPVISVLTK